MHAAMNFRRPNRIECNDDEEGEEGEEGEEDNAAAKKVSDLSKCESSTRANRRTESDSM